jgi:hypothetical protein
MLLLQPRSELKLWPRSESLKVQIATEGVAAQSRLSMGNASEFFRAVKLRMVIF